MLALASGDLEGSMALRRVAVVSRATGLSLGALGMFWGGFAAWLPEYKARTGVDDGLFGTLLLGSAVGGMAAMALAPRVGRALGARVLPITAALMALAALAPLAIQSGATLALALVAMGAAMSSLDIAANVRISELEHETGLPLMNWNHALFSAGFALSALAMGAVRRAGVAPEVAAPVLAAVLALAAVAVIERAHPTPSPEEASAKAGARTPWAAVLPAAAILFAAFVSENATETWSALHIERSLGGRPGEGALGPAMLGLTMAAGRFGGQMLAARLGEARLVALSAALGLVGALVVAAAGVQWIAVLGVGLIGAGVAVVVPSANSLLGARVQPAERALAISRAWMIGFTGFFIGPVAMGAVAQGFGLRFAFVAIALVMATILPGLARLVRRMPQPGLRAASKNG